MRVFSYRNFRVIALLGILFVTLVYSQEQKRSTTSWYEPVTVVIFPINADNAIPTASYIGSLDDEVFSDIDHFFARQSREYSLIAQQPIRTVLGTEVTSQPPSPPTSPSIVSAIWFSLKLRLWAYHNTPDDISNHNRIRLFVMYHQPQQGMALAHSLGLEKGLIGVVHAFAEEKQTRQNAVVMAHEILHTVGASDKYDRELMPIYPDGFAEPQKSPLYPQNYAEIMAGRIAVSSTDAKIPENLKQVKVGIKTAQEINWLPDEY